jgi:hypothetical protein
LPYRKAAVIKEGTVVTNGLTANYYEGDWKLSAMFLNPYSPFKQGPVPELFDLSLRRPVTNNYAFIYTGYLDIPQEGVYNFYAPVEMYCPKFDAGYDLRVFLDNEEWYPGTRLHNLGVWSVPLERGKHQLRVIYADMRPGQAQWQYPYAEFEAFQVWRGEKPVLEISGPGLEKQPLPAKMLFH